MVSPDRKRVVGARLVASTLVGAVLAAAASALTGVPTENGGLLWMRAGALLFAGYGLAFAAAGTRLVLRRDIA